MQPRSRYFALFLASITALTSLSIDMSLPAVPAIEQSFHLYASHGSLNLTFFLAGYAITPLAGGPLADRFGRRPVLLSSLALFLVAAFACSLAPTFPAMLFFRLLQGSASGVAVALPLAIVRDVLEGHEARQQIAAVTTINGTMPLIAPILGSLLMRLGSWRLIFAAQAVFAIAVIAVTLIFFDESMTPSSRQELSLSGVARTYSHLVAQRSFVGFSLIYALNFACIFSFISSSPLLLMERLHVNRSTYTALFALTLTGTILGARLSGVLSRRKVPIHRVLGVGLGLMTITVLAAGALQLSGRHGPAALLPLVFVVFVCFGLTSPGVTLAALDSVPHVAGSGSGALRSMQMIFGSGASGFLAAYCARSGIWPGTIITLTMSAAMLISLTLYVGALRERS